MADLNQFLNRDLTTGDVAHTNGYADVAGGAGAGGLSMEQRRKLLNQPRVVGAYRYSHLGRQVSSVKSRPADQTYGRVYVADSDSLDDSALPDNRQRGGIHDKRQIDAKTISRSQHYVEPPPRKYNKYD